MSPREPPRAGISPGSFPAPTLSGHRSSTGHSMKPARRPRARSVFSPLLLGSMAIATISASCSEKSEPAGAGDASTKSCDEVTTDLRQECVADATSGCHTPVYCCACLLGCGSGSWVCVPTMNDAASCPSTPPTAGTRCETLTLGFPCVYCGPSPVFAECVETPAAGKFWLMLQTTACSMPDAGTG
jgi:hypothetical protein